MIEVVIKPENLPSRTLRFFKEAVVVGRDPICDLYVDDRSCSRRHARIWFEEGALYIEDLGSANGVYLGSRRIDEAAEVVTDAEYLAGHTRLRFAFREDSIPSDALLLRYREGEDLIEVKFDGRHPYLIGRSANADLVIDDPQVSLRHARIELIGNEFHLMDVASINGTYVNDNRIEDVVLHAGDRLMFGSTQMAVMDSQGKSAEEWDQTFNTREPRPVAEPAAQSLGEPRAEQKDVPTLTYQRSDLLKHAETRPDVAAPVSDPKHAETRPNSNTPAALRAATPAVPERAAAATAAASPTSSPSSSPAKTLALPAPHRRGLYLGLFVLLAGTLAAGYYRAWIAPGGIGRSRERLRGHVVGRIRLTRQLSATAKLVPYRVSPIGVEQPAVLAQYAVEPGSLVTAGQVIAFLETPPLPSGVAESSPRPAPHAAAGMLKSPIGGIVLEIRVHAGDLVHPGESVVLVGDPTRLAADFGIAATELEHVESGQELLLQTEAGEGKRSQTVAGVVDSVTSRADPVSGLYRVLVAIDNSTGGLQTGTQVRLEKDLAGQEALAVPERVILSNAGKSAVWVARDGTAKLVSVELGESQGEMRVIRGLREGDVALEAGGTPLRPGMPLELIQ